MLFRSDLVAVSRLVPWKNIDLLITVAQELQISLVIIGDGPLRLELENQSQGWSKIQFTGSLSEDEVYSFLCKSRIFCQISDYEGLSFSLLQAMSVGLPTVLSDIAGNRQIFELEPKSCVLVNLNRKDEIKSKIDDLLKSKDKMWEMGEVARSVVCVHFNEEKQFEKIELLLGVN